jgi:hypothetical protein
MKGEAEKGPFTWYAVLVGTEGQVRDVRKLEQSGFFVEVS